MYDYTSLNVNNPSIIPHAIWYVYTWRSLAPARQPREGSRQNRKYPEVP